MSYQGYKVKDFLLDGSFRKWVMESDPEVSAFWELWLKNNPGKAQEIQEARDILLMIRFKEHHPESRDQREGWERIIAAIRDDDKVVPMPLPESGGSGARAVLTPGQTSRRWAGYAAALAGSLMAGILVLYLYFNRSLEHTTGYGEVKTIVLPDNSVVKLNANSTLHYPRAWKWGKQREVWLDGEAFFTVVHKSNDQRFLVHTDDVTVQVLGTEFNVNSRHIATSVVLNNGSVRLRLNPAVSGQRKKEEQDELVMQPGDMVSWSVSTGQLQTGKVDPELHSSWRTNILLFKDAPVTDVVRSLRDNFGLDIRLKDDRIGEETFTGSVPMDDPGVFFKTLSRSLNVVTVKKEGVIYILEDKTEKELNLN